MPPTPPDADLIVLLDCGDTIIDEGTEVRDEHGVVISGEVLPGADRMVKDLVEAGFRIALVADGGYLSFENLLTRNGVFELFESLTVSELVRDAKPSPRMFKAALGSLDLDPADAARCVMVGNNLERDVAGANRMGMTSIHMAWTERYPRTPSAPDEVPDHVIDTPAELLPLLLRLRGERATSPAGPHPEERTA